MVKEEVLCRQVLLETLRWKERGNEKEEEKRSETTFKHKLN